ncbi:MAG: hypothetical protein J2P47_04050 [Acetobacteraceae bacterium]|nr:hypothetical protein [Acetobacteraceae bacterium]
MPILRDVGLQGVERAAVMICKLCGRQAEARKEGCCADCLADLLGRIKEGRRWVERLKAEGLPKEAIIRVLQKRVTDE